MTNPSTPQTVVKRAAVTARSKGKLPEFVIRQMAHDALIDRFNAESGLTT